MSVWWCTVNRPKEIVPWWFSQYLLSQRWLTLGELSQNLSAHRWIVPMTFCPNAFCPNAYLSQKKVNCPKCQKSQLHFVPKAKCPNYILSQYPFVSWKSVPTPQIPIPFLTRKAILPVLMQDTVSPSELSQWLLLSRWIVPNTSSP